MRLMDILMAFPGIALAAVLLAAFGNSVPTIIIAIAIIYTPQLARVVRANVLAQYGEDYVRAERVIGAGRFYILLKHIVRNTAAPVLVFATVMVADAIILEASLSFLGAGVQDPAPSWGNVISYGRNLVLSGGWWATTFAGLTILLTVLSLNILAEGLTDAMVNPKLRKAPVVKDDDGASAVVAGAAVGAAVDTESPPPWPSLQWWKSTSSTASAPLTVMSSPRSTTTRPPSSPIRSWPRPTRTCCWTGNWNCSRPSRPSAPTASPRSRRTPATSSRSRTCPSASRAASATPRSWTTSPSRSAKARPWAWSANPAAASPSPPSRSWACCPRPRRSPVPSSSTARNSCDPATRHSSAKAYEGLRGEQIAMVYQDALSSLNPSMKIKDQMEQLTKRGGRKTPAELLELVKLDPVRTLASYPHELSGGQRQRVLIAMALSRSPKIVVADEPTTALDVTVQKQVVDLLNELREQLGFAMVFVSHDLALVASLAHRITVMYAGQVVESAQASELLQNPKHEYTRGLLGAVLSIEADAVRLHQIPGTVPSPRDFAPGDRFAARSLRSDADPNQQLVLTSVPSAGGEDADHYWASHLKEDAK